MKHAIIIAALLSTTAVHAQGLYINTVGGQIELKTQACPNLEGKKATLVYQASSGWFGGAAGCWNKRGDKIVIRWLKSVRPDMPPLDIDEVQTFDAAEARRIGG